MTQTDLTALLGFAKSCDDLQRSGDVLAWMVRSGRLEPSGRSGYTVKVVLPKGIAGVVPVEADGATMLEAVNALHQEAIRRGVGQLGAPF
jgi:hypothetical protein